MNDLPLEHVQSESEPPPPVEGDLNGPAKKRSRTVNVIVIIAVIIVAACIIAALVFGGTIFFMSRGMDMQEAVEVPIDEYMRAMANKDAEAAYALFSTRAQTIISVSDLEEMLRGDSFASFAGYQDVKVETFALPVTESDQDGRLTDVSAAILYTDGYTASVSAVLEQENGEWMLSEINVDLVQFALPTPLPTARPVSLPPDPALGDTWVRPADDMVMVYVPGGEFEMGSDDKEVDAAFEMCNKY